MKAAQAAAASIIGISSGEFIIDVAPEDHNQILVNWRESMKVGRDVQKRVEAAVKEALPSRYKHCRVSVT